MQMQLLSQGSPPVAVVQVLGGGGDGGGFQSGLGDPVIEPGAGAGGPGAREAGACQEPVLLHRQLGGRKVLPALSMNPDVSCLETYRNTPSSEKRHTGEQGRCFYWRGRPFFLLPRSFL